MNPFRYSLVISICFAAVNFLAAYEILKNNHLLSSYGHIKVSDESLVLACMVVTLTSAVALIISTSKIRLNGQLNSSSRINDKMTAFSAIWQLLFIWICLKYGINIVGHDNSGDTSLKYIFFVLPADSFFLATYAFARSSKYFKFNAAIYIFSNLLRGWSGAILLVLFVETYFMMKRGRYKTILGLALLIFLSYPFLLFLKWYIRSGYQFDVAGLVSGMTWAEYMYWLNFGINHLVIRFEIISATIAPLVYFNELSMLVQKEDAFPLWLDNSYSMLLNKIIYGERPLSLTTLALDTNMMSGTEMASQTSSISIPLTSYLIIGSAYDLFFNVCYVFLIMAMVLIITRSISGSESGRIIVLYLTFAFLIPGWVGSILVYLQVIIVYFMISKFLNYITPKNR